MDSNSVEGAVLKGWVENRFGIPPRFHYAPLDRPDGDAYQKYALERTRGRAFTSAIDAQLDLVYTYMQYELRRRHPGVSTLTLYRGQNSLTPEQRILDLGVREWVVRLNNVASFTDEREHAWEFGSFVIEAKIAIPRIFFAGHLLPRSILRGEREYLVIGSDVKARRMLA
jgi:NAD+--dinitrogen-reductase ADP-D-ribosyltransferase